MPGLLGGGQPMSHASRIAEQLAMWEDENDEEGSDDE